LSRQILSGEGVIQPIAQSEQDVAGASRRRGLAAAIALGLAADGWDVATTYWRAYDATMSCGRDGQAVAQLDRQLRASGAATAPVEADLADITTPPRVFDTVEAALGPVTALVLAHGHSVDSGMLDTTVESFERRYAVNSWASWLLIRAFGWRFHGARSRGRIVSLTSDHVAGNVPYGASKGALDRITLAAAREFGHLGITANVINPGPHGCCRFEFLQSPLAPCLHCRSEFLVLNAPAS
jgi:3-oxoacyl-[acyl-carrier protein] reductase